MTTNLMIATDVVLAAGPVLGGVGVTGLAVADGYLLLLGLRGAKRVKLDRDKAAWMGIVFGVLAIATGGTIGQLVQGVATVPTSVGQGLDFGASDLAPAAVAILLGITTFVPDWKKLGWPAVFGICLGASAASIGGLWQIANNLVMMLANMLGAL
ncbi:hypothetical protein OG444_40610 (plasmid) [Streptomyces sp. NBC_01232]|uniref:hypothetical protein n=1 Tax=Streptomyces TaxID=1883 RepID=UPI002E1064A7|nr:hypothetical protein OG444_40610 [Streptomyces sp. NBC_01232]